MTNNVEAAPIKILSNSSHSYSTIGSTINQLLGRSYTSTEFTIDYTTYTSCTDGVSTYAGATPLAAISTITGISYCDSSSATTTPPFPYQIFSTSFTANPGDSVATYNQFAAYDLTDDYAFTASPSLKTPPAFYTAPGNGGWASAAGVEWTLDSAVFCSASLSCLTAANTGIMAWLRFNHPTWNWYDVKAGLRQSSTNWATGYNSATYGFGTTTTTTTNALADNQILLQPPPVATSTSGVYNQLTFTVYPFKQTRRVKEVLFQFSSAPAFQANELTLANIQALGGTKITEYTGTTATTTAPVFTAVSGAYFVWLTADNATDSAASFSRIDTYSILGPLSQNEVQFANSFNIVSPASATSATPSPTFSWGTADSYLGISKYQLFVDGILNKDNIAGTSATPTSNLSEGAHTWYVKAFNGGGAATTTTSTPTINIVSGYATGYTFYVNNALGNDNNPGTQTLPWATLSKAGLTAVAGDTVVIIKNANTPYRETLTPSRDGTSGLPITFRGVDANNKPEIWGSTDVSSGWSVYSGGNANTYQYGITTSVQVLAAGSSITSLTKKTQGTAAATLNPGEWFWVSSVLYYRLASGETMGALQIEASTRNSGITSTSYATYQNIIVRYANVQGVSLTSTGGMVQGVEVYDSQRGFYVIGGTSNSIRYSVGARNKDYGFYFNFPLSVAVYNSIFYGNTTGGGRITTLGITTMTLRNNVFSGNGGSSISFQTFSASASITASNNLWDIAGDSNWDTRKGTSNQELTDPLLISPGASNFALQQFSPAIDVGTSISGLTTDILGNPIYGTPDIGGYEYQPPYVIASSNVPIGGSFRVFKDGRYRMTTATSSSATANMTVTPSNGFPSGDYSEWLNVSIGSWNTSGDYSKSWTENSTAATSTVHTIGNLRANTYYSVLADSTQYASMLSDGNGQGTFTYTGGYSTHTFNITEDTVAPVAPTSSSPTGTVGGDPQTFSWSAASDASSGLAKYQLYTDDALKEDNIATTSTQTSASGFSCGNHTWFVRAIDNAGNSINSNTQTFTVACGGGGIFSGPASSLPGYVAPRLQTIAPDGKVTYWDEKVAAVMPAAASAKPQKITINATPPSFTRTLRRGARGSDITALQEFLKKYPSIYPEGLVTGYFGAATERAIKRFQKKYGIVSSGTPGTTGYGVIGPTTREKLKLLYTDEL